MPIPASRVGGSAAEYVTSISAYRRLSGCSTSARTPRYSIPATRSLLPRQTEGAQRRPSSGSMAHARWSSLREGVRGLWPSIVPWPDGSTRADPPNAILIWVTGRGTYDEFARYHRPPHVQVLDFLDPMGEGYAVADLVVSRAGMITVAELCAWGLANVLVPLPTAAADHQTHNARVLAASGASVLLPQAELTPDRLRDVITELLNDPDRPETDGRAGLGARKTAGSSRYSVELVDTHLLRWRTFGTCSNILQLAHQSWLCSIPRISALSTSWESAGPG